MNMTEIRISVPSSKENRLIAPHEVRQAVDCFQHDFFKHHITDIVYLTISSTAFVVGAPVILLICVQTFGSTEVEL